MILPMSCLETIWIPKTINLPQNQLILGGLKYFTPLFVWPADVDIALDITEQAQWSFIGGRILFP